MNKHDASVMEYISLLEKSRTQGKLLRDSCNDGSDCITDADGNIIMVFNDIDHERHFLNMLWVINASELIPFMQELIARQERIIKTQNARIERLRETQTPATAWDGIGVAV